MQRNSKLSILEGKVTKLTGELNDCRNRVQLLESNVFKLFSTEQLSVCVPFTEAKFKEDFFKLWQGKRSTYLKQSPALSKLK